MLQAQLIKAEREKILQQVKTGDVPAEAVIPQLRKLAGDEDDFDEDDVARIRAAAKKGKL